MHPRLKPTSRTVARRGVVPGNRARRASLQLLARPRYIRQRALVWRQLPVSRYDPQLSGERAGRADLGRGPSVRKKLQATTWLFCGWMPRRLLVLSVRALGPPADHLLSSNPAALACFMTRNLAARASVLQLFAVFGLRRPGNICKILHLSVIGVIRAGAYTSMRGGTVAAAADKPFEAGI